MTLKQQLLARTAGDEPAAAALLAQGLHYFSPTQPLRQGYSKRSAVLSAAEVFALTEPEVWAATGWERPLCATCEGSGVVPEEHGPGLTEYLGCQDCRGTGTAP
jgi:hypothetical protein